ncbi:MAG: hypothetical protein FWH22_10770 [Fibromonadales bacterium]|nr:hypothetical protein [Fibromonadales bacterium]
MFTMKKVAIVGFAAGLAALSMSCSDDSGSDPAGKITGFSAQDKGERVEIAGTITANGDRVISSVAVTANDNELVVGTTLTSQLPIAEVELDGTEVSGVCGSSTGAITTAFTITATFDDNSTVSATVSNVAVNCGGGGPITGSSYDFSLSTAGHSYVDLDEKKTYSAATGTPPLDKIDIAAFYPAGGCTNGFVCSPAVIAVLTGEAFLIPVVSGTALLNSGDFDEFKELYIASGDVDEWADEVSIEITDGTWFLVDSTDGGMFAVKIDSSTSSSVSLKSYTLI